MKEISEARFVEADWGGRFLKEINEVRFEKGDIEEMIR